MSTIGYLSDSLPFFNLSHREFLLELFKPVCGTYGMSCISKTISDASILSSISSDNYLKIPSLKICNYFSKYIEEDKIRDFFQLHDNSAINFLHINCRSLKKKIENVKLLLSNFYSPLTAVALSETWLKASNEDAYNIPGYSFVSSLRNTCQQKRAGGVGLYINSNLDYKTSSDISRSLPPIECIYVEICQFLKRNILIGRIYRPPGCDVKLFNTDLLLLLESNCFIP